MNEPNPLITVSKTQWRAPHYAVGTGLLIVGILIGRAVFPLVVDRPLVVEKRIEIPVERVVEKRIEIPVERRVEVPVEKVVYVSERAQRGSGAAGFLISPEKLAMWQQIKVGMTRKQVTDILGAPTGISDSIHYSAKGVRMTVWFWGSGEQLGSIYFEHGGGGGVTKVSVPER
jgi:hypothetical protein